MRAHAVAPAETTDGGNERFDPVARELTRACGACTRNEFAIDGLTEALARLRRGAVALRDESVELRAEVSRLQQRRIAAPR